MNSQEPAAPNTDSAAAPIPLDLSPEAMRTLGEDVLARIVTHLAEVPERHAGGSIESGRIPPAEVEAFCAALPVSPPEEPQPVGPILDQLFEEWIPSSYLTTGPGYLAYVPGGGLFASAIATFIAAATNRFTGVWAAAPILVELEGRAIGRDRSRRVSRMRAVVRRSPRRVAGDVPARARRTEPARWSGRSRVRRGRVDARSAGGALSPRRRARHRSPIESKSQSGRS